MPAKNALKTYIENGYYHVYNRGVEKRQIFLDEQDCKVFLRYVKLYLSPVEELIEKSRLEIRIRRFIPLNLSKEIDLLAFALMPNHIHLQLKQYSKDGIVKLTRRLFTSYVMYFNTKYKRVGSLFQNRYKAALIDKDIYLLHLSRYIHLNPIRTTNSPINFVEFSSYPYYLGKRRASWIRPQEILKYFKSAQRQHLEDVLSYQSFVEDYTNDPDDFLGDLKLEEN